MHAKGMRAELLPAQATALGFARLALGKTQRPKPGAVQVILLMVARKNKREAVL